MNRIEKAKLRRKKYCIFFHQKRWVVISVAEVGPVYGLPMGRSFRKLTDLIKWIS